jgi:hypothetical protein
LVLDKIRRRFPWLDPIWAEGVYNAWQVDAAVERCRRCAWRSSSGATIRRALSSYRAAGWSTHLLLVRPKSACRQGLREPRRNLGHLRYPRVYPAGPQAARPGVGCGPRYTVTKVGKSDCEGTFAGAFGNDEDAPASETLHDSGPSRSRHAVGRFDPEAAIRLSYSTTSSARARIEGGTVRPSALAVLRLTTSSNLVGCSTGRSAGLAPLRILPA